MKTYKILIFLILIPINLFANDIEKIIDYQARKFKYILETAYINHIDTINIDEACENAFRALLTSFDKQSNYYSEKQLKEYQEKNTGRTVGIGINVVPIGDSIVIASVQENSPANKAGIKKGDFLLFVDNQAVTGRTQQEINQMLTGDSSSSVNLIVKTIDNVLKNYVIKREDFKVSSVASSFYLDKQKIAYIASSHFTSNVYDDLTKVIDNYIKRGIECLILDLRGNSGGFLDEVVKVTAEFLPANRKILYTSSRNPQWNYTFSTDKNGKYLKLPLIILVDEQTASAAEIFAAVMQDNDRAIIIGENTFGKGTVQKLWTLNDGSGFRLTVAEYFTSDGRRIDRELILRNVDKISIDEGLKLSVGDQAFKEMKEMIEKTGGATKYPTYKTLKGRNIITKGGVFPDEIAKSDTLTLLSRVLMSRGILIEFSYKYFLANREFLNQKFKDIENYLLNFNVNDVLYNEFHKFSLSKNIWNAEMAKIDENIIKNLIKAYIAIWLWDNYGFLAVRVADDKVFHKALTKIENAKLLVK